MISSWFFPNNYSRIIVPSLTKKFPGLIQQFFIYPKLFHHFRTVSNDFPMMLSMFFPVFLIISLWCPHNVFNFPTPFPRIFPWFSRICPGFSHHVPAFSCIFRFSHISSPSYPQAPTASPPSPCPRGPLRRVGRRGVALRDGPRAAGKTTTTGRGGVDEADGMGWDEFSIITI